MPFNFQYLAFPDRLTGRRVSIALVARGGKLLLPKKLRTQIKLPLTLIQSEAFFFARLCRKQALPPLGSASIFAKYSSCGRVLLVFRCVAIACRRLTTAPADIHMAYSTWGWAEMVMERVTRGRVKKVQVLLQRRACCAVLCACRASACVRCVFDACCRKRWLVFRSVAAHRSCCIECAAAFILVCRLLPPALQADRTFGNRQNSETALLCFAI